MAYYHDLLGSAARLIGSERGRPQFSNCNRAVSTAYYALFDALCRLAANRVCGPLRPSQIPDENWIGVYRSIDHRTAKLKLEKYISNPVFVGIALPFKKLQEARHEADYDPSRQFSKAEANALLSEARAAIDFFEGMDRDALTILIISLLDLKTRN